MNEDIEILAGLVTNLRKKIRAQEVMLAHASQRNAHSMLLADYMFDLKSLRRQLQIAISAHAIAVKEAHERG